MGSSTRSKIPDCNSYQAYSFGQKSFGILSPGSNSHRFVGVTHSLNEENLSPKQIKLFKISSRLRTMNKAIRSGNLGKVKSQKSNTPRGTTYTGAVLGSNSSNMY